LHALHILFVSTYPILFLISHNATEACLGDAAFPLALSLAFSIFAYLKLGFVIKDAYARSLVVSLFMALFFSFGHAAGAFEPLLGAFAEHFAAAAWTIVFFIAAAGIVRAKDGLDVACGFLNIISGIAVVLAAVNIVIVSSNAAAPADYAPDTTAKLPSYEVALERLACGVPAAASGETALKRPSIYYIILDGYARNDVMNEVYHHDDSKFLRFLNEKGFFVAEKSLANHATLTRHSLVSSLNMQYLQKIFAGTDPGSRDLAGFIDRFKDNEAVKYAKSKGYRYVAFYTFGTYRNPALEDAYLAPPGYYEYQPPSSEEFSRLLLNTTPIPYLAGFFGIVSELSYPGQIDYLRKSTNFIFDTLPKVARTAKNPIFVYAHIGQPHPPFIFDSDGSAMPAGRIGDVIINDAEAIVTTPEKRAEYRDRYTRQASFIAKRAMEAIDGILKNSPEPPVIILQSDHGPASEFKMSTLEGSNLKERFAILNAFYFPGGKYSGISHEISPVNNFRMVFDRFLDAKMELLTNECYFSTIDMPYKFTRIDGLIKN